MIPKIKSSVNVIVKGQSVLCHLSYLFTTANIPTDIIIVIVP